MFETTNQYFFVSDRFDDGDEMVKKFPLSD